MKPYHISHYYIMPNMSYQNMLYEGELHYVKPYHTMLEKFFVLYESILCYETLLC